MTYWAQESIKKQSQAKILSSLIAKPKTFKELEKETELSKPILSKHLTELKKKEDLVRTVINDQVVYKLTEKAKEKGYVKRIQFEAIIYAKFILEFLNKLPEDRDNAMVFLESKDEHSKFALDLIDFIDAWITPFAFHLMFRRIKTQENWSLKPLQNAILEIVNLYAELFEKPLREGHEQEIEESFQKALKQKYPQQIEEIEKIVERPDEYMSIVKNEWVEKKLERGDKYIILKTYEDHIKEG